MRFRTTLEQHGRTATGFEVPDELVEALGAGRKPPVRVTIGGHTYRSTIASRGGRHLLGVSAENRERSGIEAGDELLVELELDTAPRTIEAPADLLSALEPHPQARAFFDGLSYSQKQWFVLSVEGAKTEATRQRRVEKAVGMLRAGRKR